MPRSPAEVPAGALPAGRVWPFLGEAGARHRAARDGARGAGDRPGGAARDGIAGSRRSSPDRGRGAEAGAAPRCRNICPERICGIRWWRRRRRRERRCRSWRDIMMVNSNQLFRWRRQLLPKAVVESGAMVPVEIAPDEGGPPRRTDREGVIEIAFGCGARGAPARRKSARRRCAR